MNLTKHILSTLFFCLLLCVIEFWAFFSYMTIDSAMFDYRTSGNFWLRTSVADFFIGFWQWLFSPQFYEFTVCELVQKSKTIITLIVTGLLISLLSIYYGFSANKKTFVILGAAIWFSIFLLWLYLVN